MPQTIKMSITRQTWLGKTYLLATNNIELIALINPANVASLNPSIIRYGLRSLFWFIEVALHEKWGPNVNMPFLAYAQQFAIIANYFRL